MDKIAMNERNIRQALVDYRRYTSWTEEIDNVSDAFIERLARDNFEAKSELRELFRKSPVWDEELDAIVINGTRTHEPDYERVRYFANCIFSDYIRYADRKRAELVYEAIEFFADPNLTDMQKQRCIDAINLLAPKAYQPDKKITRVFKALCQATGTIESLNFNYNFAQLADEITSHKIDFKLFVSVNPAHFITMSNPKNDVRGDALTSCHSFNNTNYTYNCGCSGYARDDYTFIVFTVVNPDNRETLNNRKNMRQIFWYKPGSGVLLQSRLYNSAGGTRREMAESRIYRDLIQREISDLEGAPNLWKTDNYVGNSKIHMYVGDGFGGYPDWEYSDFAAKISIRNDHADEYSEDKPAHFYMGTYGLCIKCGEEISEGLYCHGCDVKYNTCDCCGERFAEDELYSAFDANGNEVLVCQSCLDDEYGYCNDCGCYYHNDALNVAQGGRTVCNDCLELHYTQCEVCGEWVNTAYTHTAIDADGTEIEVCPNCSDQHFEWCEDCGELVHTDLIHLVYDENGTEFRVCTNCLDNYDECSQCGRMVRRDALKDGLCPECAEENDGEAA